MPLRSDLQLETTEAGSIFHAGMEPNHTQLLFSLDKDLNPPNADAHQAHQVGSCQPVAGVLSTKPNALTKAANFVILRYRCGM